MAWRLAHRGLAVLIVVFLIQHFAIHLVALLGREQHMAALSAVQGIYRNAFVEPVLLAALALQIVIGLRLILARWHQADKGFWGWAQISSGLYIAVFAALHSIAALSARHVYAIDTNFYWPAGTLNTAPLYWFFAPYYVLAVMAVFTHLAAALRFGWPASRRIRLLAGTLVVSGAGLGVAITAAFAGAFYDITLPPEYVEYYQGYVDQVTP